MNLFDRRVFRGTGRGLLLLPVLLVFLPSGRAQTLRPLYPGDRTFEARFLEGAGATFFLEGSGKDRYIFVRTDPLERWPGVRFHPPGRAWDLSDQLALAASVRNDGKAPIHVSLRADCGKRGWKDVYIQTTRTLAPGEKGILFLYLLPYYPQGRKLSFPGMRKGPPFSTDFDPSWITRILVFATGKEKRRRFSILSLEIAGRGGTVDRLPPPWKFFPMIDRFGQYMHRSWPGKTYSVEEMRGRLRDEEADLAAHPGPPGRDLFGGWLDGPAFGATGNFRTVKYRGKWWLLDPEGRLFWSFGVDCLGIRLPTPISLRKNLFSFLPGRKTKAGRFYGKSYSAPLGFYAGKTPYETFDFLGLNLSRKYGPDWRKKYVALTLRRMRSWGFNTIGNWSDQVMLEAHKVPYVVPVHYSCPPIQGSRGYWGKFPDVFHPLFRENLRRRLSLEKNRSARDPWCIGYFVDNELSWGKKAADLAAAAWRSPAGQPARKALFDFLEKKYKTARNLNRSWKTRFSGWKAVRSAPAPPGGKSVAADLAEFGKVLYETYFRTVREEIRRASPKKLYLGCRFSTANSDVVLAAAKFCDVLSFNWYSYSVARKTLPEGVDKPVIIGEFHFGALDRGLFHPGLRPALNQAHRARLFRSYIEGALGNPFIVGAHWFKYQDEPTTGRFDGENYQIGFTDVCDTPYPEMVRAARRIGRDLYRLRLGEKAKN